LHTFTKEESELVINHFTKSEEAIFDLCDLDGKIRLSGSIIPQEQTKIDVSDISSGCYHLFIIDEGEVKKSLVNL